jgi:enoyl-CoA hydratase/carnithine racemase
MAGKNWVGTIHIDDGKRNALSPAVLRELYQTLDEAELMLRD